MAESREDTEHAPVTSAQKLRLLTASDLVDLVQTEIGGAFAYVATGPDPQMMLFDPGTESRLVLGVGVYRFFFQGFVTRGKFVRPRLYLDFGQGFSEDPSTNVFLKCDRSDVWFCDIDARRRIVGIRFDPSETKVRFTLIKMAIEQWGPERLSVGANIYKTLRALNMKLPLRLQFRKLLDSESGYMRSAAEEALSQEVAPAGRAALSVSNAPAPVGDSLDIAYAHQYFADFGVATGARDPAYAPLRSAPTPVAPDDPKVIAFYLPQFHPFPENDRWWGRGFTEWTNVSKAVPQFLGHYQPRLPGELGFYDLRLPEIMARQFELAKLYGLNGFCFHYYWFAGKRLLERPIETLLAQKGPEFDFPFCLCWANENWTRRWDGAESDVLMKQSHDRQDHENVFDDLSRYLKDPRYIRVDGKPMIVVYRPSIIPNIAEMVEIWREKATRAGLPGIYLVATTAFGFDNPREVGFDALVQFPPHAISTGEINANVELLNPVFEGRIYDYADTVESVLGELRSNDEASKDRVYFPGVMTAWDNEARKPGRGHVFHNATPKLFHRWFEKACDWSKEHNRLGERFVFVNAWNEWAEGTYLEPDRKMGYAYLSAIAATRDRWLPQFDELTALARSIEESQRRSSDTAVFLHIFYEDLIEEFAAALARARTFADLDLIVTIPASWSVASAQKLIAELQPTRLLVCENRGRDVWPFIQALRATAKLDYRYGCKIHSKKSLHLAAGGNKWRQGLIDGLIGEAALNAARETFETKPKAGLAAPSDAFFSIDDPSAIRDNYDNMKRLMERSGVDDTKFVDFVAGTMFWFRIEAMRILAAGPFDADDFDVELGAIDGTTAHAFERIIPTLVVANGYDVAAYSTAGAAAAPY